MIPFDIDADPEWAEIIQHAGTRFAELAWEERVGKNPKLGNQRVKKQRFIHDVRDFVVRYANSLRREGLPEYVVLATLGGSIGLEFRVGSGQLLKGLPQMLSAAAGHRQRPELVVDATPEWQRLLESRLGTQSESETQ